MTIPESAKLTEEERYDLYKRGRRFKSDRSFIKVVADAAAEKAYGQAQRDTIDALNDYGSQKISLERLAERLGMNIYELIDAMREYATTLYEHIEKSGHLPASKGEG